MCYIISIPSFSFCASLELSASYAKDRERPRYRCHFVVSSFFFLFPVLIGEWRSSPDSATLSVAWRRPFFLFFFTALESKRYSFWLFPPTVELPCGLGLGCMSSPSTDKISKTSFPHHPVRCLFLSSFFSLCRSQATPSQSFQQWRTY